MARLSALLVCLARFGGWRAMARNHGSDASANGGGHEAAMPGAIDIAPGVPVVYDEVVHAKPNIGAEGRAARAADISRALAAYVRASALVWFLAGGPAWAP